MKLASLLALVTAVAALPTTSNVLPRASVAKVDGTKFSTDEVATTRNVLPRASIAKVDGTKFKIDGVTKYYAGTNSYWMPFLTNDTDVDTIMSHLQTSGLKILRVWGFNDVKQVPADGSVYFQLFSGSTAAINTGPNGLQRLDAVVRAAEKYNIKLIISFVNNWKDYGGMEAYFSTCGVITKWGWYTSTKCQSLYQTYIKTIVSRYRTSSAIFAWELANEPRCLLCPTSVITNWARKTSDYIKSLDADHMIAIGDEGFGLSGGWWYPYSRIEGFDWATNLALPNISFGTFHLYPEAWAVFWNDNFGQSWITAHAAICKRLNKPCLLEEYGKPTAADHCPVEGAWQNSSLALKDSGMAGDLFWQFGDTIPSAGQLSANDGFTIYRGTEDWKCLVDRHVKNIG